MVRREEVDLLRPLEEAARDKSKPTFIIDLAQSTALLNFDQTYKGRTILVPRRYFEDPLEVDFEYLHVIHDEMLVVARAIKNMLNPVRINFCALGNKVPQFHWHLIPRYEGDLNWGYAPWPVRDRVLLEAGEYRDLAKILRSEVTNLRGGQVHSPTPIQPQGVELP